MKLDEENERNGEIRNSVNFMAYAIAGVTFFILLVLTVVIFVNKDQLFRKENTTLQMVSEEEATSIEESELAGDKESLISGSTLVSDDLDIWEEYAKEESSEDLSEATEESSEEDPSCGGTKTLVKYADGREEWIAISKYLPQNEYDDAGFVLGNGRMSYYNEGEKVSYSGIDISKYQGYVDFNAVKKDGIDFVMIKLGARGYGTGQITLDDYYADNIKRATDAGLEVGVYFFSQAITIAEAEEEADYVIQYLADYRIHYPVVFDMEGIMNDTARIDALTKEEKTQIAKAFLTKIEAAGYNGMIYGNKEWILTKINYAALSNYDIWLAQPEDLPDYPYRFYMWQYSTTGTVDGVEGNVDMNICFIDYSVK